MTKLELLKKEIYESKPVNQKIVTGIYMYEGYMEHLDDEVPIAKAYAIESLFTKHKKHIYTNDLIAGSLLGMSEKDISDSSINQANGICYSYGIRSFVTNADHYAPNYETFLNDGIEGTLNKIYKSMNAHKDENKKTVFLKSAEITLKAFGNMILQYADIALQNDMTDIYNVCKKISFAKPETFREALQLVWFTYIAFRYEGRYAMALGRLDQYLYPFFEKDLKEGILNEEEATQLVSCTLIKIYESRFFGGDDVVNIAIAGVKPDGTGGVNKLSYIILKSVGLCNIPGPNLSARLYKGIPDEFLDECLKVIGTGLGYPALMNDEVNIPALLRHGYSLEDCRNYCMVGCIENFIQGKQPPWSDGRYNSPKYIELALNNGICMHTSMQIGPATGDVNEFDTMDKFMHALKKQMSFGASQYVRVFRNENERYNSYNYMQPFLSIFCDCCIERGLDINDGGSLYPSVHGAGCMGIATVADSLAAIEMYVYDKKEITLSTLRDAVLNNYEGYEELRLKLLSAPKYGNNNDFVDKYAVWYVDVHDEIFSKYRTRDGGAIYTAIASNVSNIPAGKEIAATPDGRKDGEPLSDAASPMHGMDKNGPTSSLKSLCKPDYTKVSCGTVVNQKYSRSVFTDPEKRKKLLALIKVYFNNGGQEIQINAVSKKVLADAITHPENYTDLVVRVSGFSAYYITLSNEVKLDILKRTEHE